MVNLLRKRPEGLTFHSDQGSQYTAYSFRKLLRDRGVRQSLSNPVPHDNAVAEAFFSILKREELSHNWYNSAEELDKTIREHIEFFNSKRPHRELNMQPPEHTNGNTGKGNHTTEQLKKKTFGARSDWTCPKSLHYYIFKTFSMKILECL